MSKGISAIPRENLQVITSGKRLACLSMPDDSQHMKQQRLHQHEQRMFAGSTVTSTDRSLSLRLKTVLLIRWHDHLRGSLHCFV